jgi:hypothetical protein
MKAEGNGLMMFRSNGGEGAIIYIINIMEADIYASLFCRRADNNKGGDLYHRRKV